MMRWLNRRPDKAFLLFKTGDGHENPVVDLERLQFDDGSWAIALGIDYMIECAEGV